MMKRAKFGLRLFWFSRKVWSIMERKRPTNSKSRRHERKDELEIDVVERLADGQRTSGNEGSRS